MTTDELRRKCEALGIEVNHLDMIDEHGLSTLLKVSYRTAQRHRNDHHWPRYTRLATQILFSLQSIADFFNTTQQSKARHLTTT